MLLIIDKPGQFDYDQIMQVYHQSLQEAGVERYPRLDDNEQLLEAEQDFYCYLNSFLRQKNSIVAVWLQNTEYASVLRIEPYCDGLLIEGLETAMKYRGRGYAKALLNAVLAYLQSDSSNKIFSHIHKDNIPSIRVHLSCGFVFLSESSVYIDGSVDNQCQTYVKEIP